MSDTPRTDACVKNMAGYADLWCPAYKMEELERELAEANADRKALNQTGTLYRKRIAELKTENEKLQEYAESLTDYMPETQASRVPTFEEWKKEAGI